MAHWPGLVSCRCSARLPLTSAALPRARPPRQVASTFEGALKHSARAAMAGQVITIICNLVGAGEAAAATCTCLLSSRWQVACIAACSAARAGARATARHSTGHSDSRALPPSHPHPLWHCQVLLLYFGGEVQELRRPHPYGEAGAKEQMLTSSDMQAVQMAGLGASTQGAPSYASGPAANPFAV